MNRGQQTTATSVGALLHLRARRVGSVALGLLILTIASWWAADWLASRTYFGGAVARPPVAGLAPLMAAVLVSLTLAGADIDLDRTTSRLTARYRTAHTVVAVTTVCTLMALAATDTPQTFGSYGLIRNSLGLIGMVLLAATVLPAALAWAPAFTYSFAIYLAAPRTPQAGSPWWAWSMQPGGLDPSWIVASALLAAGAAAYALRGPASATHQPN